MQQRRRMTTTFHSNMNTNLQEWLKSKAEDERERERLYMGGPEWEKPRDVDERDRPASLLRPKMRHHALDQE